MLALMIVKSLFRKSGDIMRFSCRVDVELGKISTGGWTGLVNSGSSCEIV